MYNAVKDPTPANIAWAAVAVVALPVGGGLATKFAKPALSVVKSAIPKMTTKLVQYSSKIGGAFKTAVNKAKVIANKNNLVRINSQRIAFGPARSHYGSGGFGSKIPYHFEINWSKKKVFLENVKTGKTKFCLGRNCYKR